MRRREDWLKGPYKVLIDGDELPLCRMADEERGEALVILEHDGDWDVYDPADAMSFIEYAVHGEIRIVPL